MSQKTYQRYTPEFKEQALVLLCLGKPVAEVEDLVSTVNKHGLIPRAIEWKCR